MTHQLQRAVYGELQDSICPKSGAGLGSIEVVGNGVIRGIQGDSIPLSIQQRRNAGSENVGLAIAAAAVEQLQQRATTELQGAAVQILNRGGIRKIEGERIIRTQGEVRRMHRRHTICQHEGQNSFTQKKR